jgi:hypothetical protein
MTLKQAQAIGRALLPSILTIAALALLGAGVWLSFLDKAAGATATYAAALLLLGFVFVDRLKSLSGLGMKLEMVDQKIAEANNALDRIRGLAASIATPIQVMIARLGTWSGTMSRKERYEFARLLEDELQLIEVPDKYLERGRLALAQRDVLDMAHPVLQSYHEQLSQYQQSLREDSVTLDPSSEEKRRLIAEHMNNRPSFKSYETVPRYVAAVHAFISKTDLLPDSVQAKFLADKAEQIADLEHFARTRKIRRLEIWLNEPG